MLEEDIAVPIKKSEGQTLLTLLRLVIISIALLGSWGMQSVADAAFNFVFNAEALVKDFLQEDPLVESGQVEGRLYVLYYDEHSEVDNATRHVYKHYYVTGDEGAWGLKDNAGRMLLPESYQDILILPEAFLLQQEQQWRFYDRQLAPLSEESWDSVELEQAESGRIISDLIKVGRDGLYGAVDLLGQLLVEPVYDDLDLYTFEVGWPISRVCRDGLYGYIDGAGQVVIALDYDYAIMSTVMVYDENAGFDETVEEPVGVEEPIVYVLKGEDWGAIRKQRDGSASRVDWDAEPAAQVISDYMSAAEPV